MSQLTLPEVVKVIPPHLKQNITQDLVDKLNNIAESEVVAEAIRSNFLSYTHVLREGRFKTEDYLNAVKYVSYKLMGHSNLDAYVKTFPQRYAALVAENTPLKEISAYVSMYNKGKLVNLILEQSLVPSWVLNQDIYQRAINTQADLMVNAKSEKVRTMAADSLLKHLAKPQEAGPLVNIDIKENSGISQLKESLQELVQQQKTLIQQGVSPKEIAEQKLMKKERDVIDV